MDVNENTSIHSKEESSLSAEIEIEDSEHHSSDCSDFSDTSCGEPLTSHHLVIDFTPNSGDTDFIQKKCCAFWDFISTCPEIEQWKVHPEPNISDIQSKSSDIELAVLNPEIKQTEDLKTAVSMLEFVEEKGLITRAFEAKLPKTGCSIGSADYFDDVRNVSEPTRKDTRKVCECKKPCESCTAKSGKGEHKKTSNVVLEMCKELNYWDIQHPKSMDPPGHPPELN